MSFDPKIQGSSSSSQSHVEDMFALYGNPGAGHAGPILNRASSAAQSALNVEPIDPNKPPKSLKGRVDPSLQKGSLLAQKAAKQETMDEFKKDVGKARYDLINKFRLAHDDQREYSKALDIQARGAAFTGWLALLALALIILAVIFLALTPAGLPIIASAAVATASCMSLGASQAIQAGTSAPENASKKLKEAEKFLTENDSKEMRDAVRRFDQANRLTEAGKYFSPDKRNFDNVTELTGIDADNPDGKNPSSDIDDLHKSVTDALPEPKRQRVVKQM